MNRNQMRRDGTTASPWDKIKKKRGKLVGMLTDELALDTMETQPVIKGSDPKLGTRRISLHKVNTKLPSKFK